MERLRCILQLIRKAVQSDFPDFETLQLFSIFDIRERHNPAKVAALARVIQAQDKRRIRSRLLEEATGSCDSAGVDREEASRTAQMTVCVDGWNEKHEKEQKFLEAKTKKRLCQALSEKAVSWDELDSETATSCAAFLAHEADLVKQAFRNKAGCKLPQPVLPEITGQTIWLGGIPQSAQLPQVLRKFSPRVVESNRTAALHLVPSLAQCSEANDCMWEIAIGGKIVLDEDCLQSGGKRGCCLTFKGACKTERVVHLTARFCDQHEVTAACVLSFCKPHRPTSKWFHESDRETFLALNAKYVAAKKATRCIVFGTPDDSAAFSGVKLFKTAQSLADLSVLDRAHCLTGLQGKQWPSASAMGGA
eukprot:s3814_g5.t1